MNKIRSQARGITSTIGCIGESGFDPVDLWVMGPPCGLEVGRAETSCAIMQEVCQGGSLSIMSATTSIPRARDEENYFPAR